MCDLETSECVEPKYNPIRTSELILKRKREQKRRSGVTALQEDFLKTKIELNKAKIEYYKKKISSIEVATSDANI